MKEEIWKDIKRYEGLYQISSFNNYHYHKRNQAYRWEHVNE